MCTKSKKYANTGLVNISTGNANLDGTGTLGVVLTAGLAGTEINAVTIKATGLTTQGMVRLFTNDGTTYYLWREIEIPQVTQTGVTPAFQITIYDNLTLNPGDTLEASTQNAESFNIYANGVNWENCDCVAECSCSTTLSVANTGLCNISAANPNLDGTGTVPTVLTAPAGLNAYGTRIPFINIKATQTTTEGMVRLFINDGVTKFLIWEVPIPGCTQTNIQPAYRTQCSALISLQAGYSLCASTENAESFNIIIFATNVTNCEC